MDATAPTGGADGVAVIGTAPAALGITDPTARAGGTDDAVLCERAPSGELACVDCWAIELEGVETALGAGVDPPLAIVDGAACAAPFTGGSATGVPLGA